MYSEIDIDDSVEKKSSNLVYLEGFLTLFCTSVISNLLLVITDNNTIFKSETPTYRNSGKIKPTEVGFIQSALEAVRYSALLTMDMTTFLSKQIIRNALIDSVYHFILRAKHLTQK